MLHLYVLVIFIKWKHLSKLFQLGTSCDGSLHCYDLGCSKCTLIRKYDMLSEIPCHSMTNTTDNKVHLWFRSSNLIQHVLSGFSGLKENSQNWHFESRFLKQSHAHAKQWHWRWILSRIWNLGILYACKFGLCAVALIISFRTGAFIREFAVPNRLN